jgi:hypothetical protein
VPPYLYGILIFLCSTSALMPVVRAESVRLRENDGIGAAEAKSEGSRMQYQLVYDVLKDDRFPWFGLVFTSVPFLFAIALLLEIIERVRGKRSVPTSRMAGRITLKATPLPLVIVFLLVLGAVGVFLASKMYEALMQRQRCQEWARAGECQSTEGTVADYYFRKGGSSFRVADQSFELVHNAAGFTGRYNVPRDAEGSLRNGLRVRLAHRDGYILRVEIATERGEKGDASDYWPPFTAHPRPPAISQTVSVKSPGRDKSCACFHGSRYTFLTPVRAYILPREG